MPKVNIIIADDQETTHKGLRKTLSAVGFEYEVLEDFYDTEDLITYLATEESMIDADILILDHDFGGIGKNGLDALKDIREICPNLPILMLSSFEDNDRTSFSDADIKYRISYIQKPAKASDLTFHINSVIRRMQSWETLQHELTENREMMDYFMEENEKLGQEIELAKSDAEAAKSEAAEKALPVEMQSLIQNIFPDVEFLSKAFRLLVRASVKTADWNRMFRILKLIDWKNENAAAAGVKIQKFKAGLKFGYKDLWEYRFSQAGRIFVERRTNDKPLIVLIDPIHAYDGLSAI
jgi:DNA-binding response OmpR family regulator